MLKYDATDVDMQEVDRLARALKDALSRESRDSTRFEVKVSDSGGGGGGGPGVIARCTIIIKSDTADEAFKHAEELTEAGWNCGSSGENEFTCTGPDEE